MKKIVFPVVATCVFLWVFPAWADVAKESFTKSGGFGGSGAFEGTTVVKLQGDKQHETTNIKFTGAVLSWAAGGRDDHHHPGGQRRGVAARHEEENLYRNPHRCSYGRWGRRKGRVRG